MTKKSKQNIYKEISYEYLRELKRRCIFLHIMTIILTILLTGIVFIYLNHITVDIMTWWLVVSDKNISKIANEIASNCEDYRCLEMLTEWVYKNIKYDITEVGRLQSSSEIMKRRKGVCKDKAILLLAMAKELGFQGELFTYDNHMVVIFRKPYAAICDPTKGFCIRLDYG